MEEPAQALLDGGASRVVAWERPPASSSSEGATVLFSSFSPAPTDDELSALEMLFEDREAAIRSGMVLEGKRFEVRQKGEKKNSSVACFFQKARPKKNAISKTGPPPPPAAGLRPRDGHGARARRGGGRLLL